MQIFIQKTSTQVELLKYIGILAMLADHIGVLYYPFIAELRGIGRLAYPLFGFVLIHNYIFYSNNKSSYIKRLLVLAVLVEPLHYLLFQKYYAGVNIFFMYAMVLSFFYIYEGHSKYFNKQKFKTEQLFILFFIFLAFSLFVEYSFLGYLLLISFYVAFKKKSILFSILSLIMLYLLSYPSLYFSNATLLLFVPVLLLVNKFDYPIARNKTFFYLFYPLHIVVLLLFSLCIK